MNHLIRLLNLHTLRVEGPPPNYSTFSLPLAFPSLTKLILGEGAARGWISLFERIEDHISTTQGVTPLSEVKGSLKFLEVESHLSPILNASFASRIRISHNLVSLNVDAHCHDEDGRGEWIFKLSNDGAAELAMALPQLEFLLLGEPCFENTCATTVVCLLPISVYCLKLKQLEIHFNTENIVNDLKNVSEEPRFQGLWLLPRCGLTYLDVRLTEIWLDGPDFETVANGISAIFPSLKTIKGFSDDWSELSRRIAER